MVVVAAGLEAAAILGGGTAATRVHALGRWPLKQAPMALVMDRRLEMDSSWKSELRELKKCQVRLLVRKAPSTGNSEG